MSLSLSSSIALFSMIAGNWLPLWPGDAPGGHVPPAGTEQEVDGRILRTEIPQYELHLADNPNGQGIVLFPGGGYYVVSMINEGQPIAKWLNEQGVSVMIVKYRVDGEKEFDYNYPVPLLDAKRAIRTMRSKADEWNLNANEIGVMGFSAGGHLAGMASTLYDESFDIETKDEIDALNARPDFTILGYPVIDMSRDFRHEGSADILTRDKKGLRKKLSLQDRVDKQTPPTFIFHSANDDVVPVKNALVYAEACAANDVSITLHVYSEGGHGYGMDGEGDFTHWPQLLAHWLEERPWSKTK